MLVWFVALSVTAVALIFGSPNIDYRLVMLGSVLPLAESIYGGRWLLHSVAFNAMLLFGVMLLGRGRRSAQRRWLALPIGTFCHLVLDGTWANAGVFWWPFTRLYGPGIETASEFQHLPRAMILEAAGLMVGVWAWHRFGLSDRSARRSLLTKGQLVAIHKP